MSNISSIANNYYSTLFETQNTTLPKSSTSINDTNDSEDLLTLLLNNGNIQSNLDGDTFQLISSTSADNSNISYDFKSGSSDPIGSFLDKVKNGTVTSDDLESMKTMLTQIPQGPPPQGPLPTNNSSSSSDSQHVIGSFLDKVKNGIVTDSDLTDIRASLNQNLK